LHASIQQNAESKNIDSLNKDTHTLKSSSHVIKAERFGEACYALELAAKQEDQLEGTLKKFNAEYEELRQRIQQKL
jgi:HPt (histidine-containing phosphotransfer) domain-containing protein